MCGVMEYVADSNSSNVESMTFSAILPLCCDGTHAVQALQTLHAHCCTQDIERVQQARQGWKLP